MVQCRWDPKNDSASHKYVHFLLPWTGVSIMAWVQYWVVNAICAISEPVVHTPTPYFSESK